jgi:arylsulfatase A-like enzyme
MRRYSAEVSGVDDGVGAVMTTLRRLNLDDDTLVIFAADQGLAAGHHGFWGMADHGRPLNTFDTGLHIPLIWRWPKHIAAGGHSDLMVSNYDLLPTLLSVLGLRDRQAAAPASPGRDYSAALRGQPVEWDNVIFYEYENSRMIRTDRWKLTRRFPDGPDELYNLAEDPGEKTNLFGSVAQVEIQGQLQQRLDGFFARYADPRYDLWKGGTSKAPFVVMKAKSKGRPGRGPAASAPAGARRAG